MKKNTIKILTCFLLSGLALASCDDPNTSSPDSSSTTPTHTHSWESVWEHDSTNHWHGCTDSTCNEVDSKAAHTWDAGTVTTQPTEEAAGVKTYECTVCDATKTEEVAKLDHTHKFAEGWTNDETHHWHAATCDHSTEVDGKAEHTWDAGTVTVEPTEEAVGEKTYECSVCDATKTEEVAKLAHTHVKAETWSTDGTNHWKECSGCEEDLDLQAHNGGTATFVSKAECEVCGEPYGDYGEFDASLLVPGEGQELAEYKVNVSEEFDAGTADSDIIKDKFTLVSGTEVRNRTRTWTNPSDPSDTMSFTKSIKLGSKTAEIKAEVAGVGMLSLWVQNGSSSAQTQKIAITYPDGTVKEIEFDGNNNGSPVIKLEIPVRPGTYSIKRVSGTVDIYNMELKTVVGIAPESGFAIVTLGQVDFLEGQSFDYSGLVLNKVFGNGRTEGLDLDDANFKIDSSDYQANVPGTYTIKLNYKEYTQLSYQVVVYDVEELSLGLDAIEKLSTNSLAGNGVYFNHSVKEVYDLNEEFDTTGLSVTVVGKNGETSKEFKVSASDITITGFDSTTAGKKDVTISYNFAGQSVSKTLTVYVVDTAPSKTNNVVNIKVNPSYDGEIGAVVEGYNMFTTIQQALDYIEGNEAIDSSDRKVVELAPGLYQEKLEITIPYLTLKGSDAETTIIEWDSLYGVADAGGFVHTTDSTATVAVRDGAVGCVIEGITISNWYNSQARFTERGKEIERGLALLVQSDKFTMKDGKLLGVQDTLELFTGRQYFENVFISGYTDFIFGTNNTTYFTNCTIHTVDTGKDDGGTNGYLTAFKGNNKGTSDYITYGAIFDGCKFTADEGVSTKQSIGRTWGPYAAVAIINSEIGGHISTTPFTTSTNKELRYTSMNGYLPTDATLQFVEYNNTGDGAVTETVAGMTYLDATTAANYSDFSVIFGTSNGAVSYLEAWDPTSTEVQVDNNVYYQFNGIKNPTGTNHVYNEELTGATSTLGGMTIDATTGKVFYRTQGDTWITAGAKLIFDVEANSSVVITTYPGYHNYTINGVATYLDSFTTYYAEDTTVTIETPSQFYLYSVVVKPNQEAPEAATLSELKVSGITSEFELGADFVANLNVEAHYSDGRLVKPAAGEFTVDSSAVNKDVAGSYDVIVSYDGGTFTYSVEYLAEVITYIETDTTWSFKDDSSNAAENYFVYDDSPINPTLTLGKLTLTDNGQGVVANNNDWLKFNSGAKASFETNAAATLSLTFYNNSNNVKVYLNDQEVTVNSNGTYTLSEAGNVVIEAVSSGYIGKISVSFAPVTIIYDTNTSIDLTEHTEQVQGTTATWKGLDIDATNGKWANNGSGWIQFNTGTKVSLNVLDDAVVTVVTHGDATDYTIEVADGVATITATGNIYISTINVAYPVEVVVFDTDTSIDLTEHTEEIQGSTATWNGLSIDATNGKWANNGSGWIQFNTGTKVSLNVLDGAEITVTTYGNAGDYTIDITDGVATITATGNIYISTINVAYPVVYNTDTTINLGECDGSYQGTTGSWKGIAIDATAGKFAPNGDGQWMQINQGTVLSLTVAEGAVVTATTYNNADILSIVVEGTTATITATGSGYIGTVTVSYPVEEASTTIYYYNSEGWTVVNAYIWDANENNAWPGVEMTAVEGKTNWYSIDIAAEDLTGWNIIFNNKVEDSGTQTSDIELVNGEVYFYGFSSVGYTSEAAALAAMESAPAVSAYSLAGSMQGWAPGATPFYTTDDENIVSLTIELAANTYEFKIAKDNSWDVSYGNSGTINDTTGENWWVMDSSTNCKLVASGGTYLFQYDIANNKIHVSLVTE